VDFLGAALRLAVGDEISLEDLEPKHQTPVIQRYAFPKPGKIVHISGADDARKVSGITDVIVTAKPGDVIPPAGDKRPSAAMVLATGSSRATALQAANDALACLKIETA
jgi:biotin carboxylase